MDRSESQLTFEFDAAAIEKLYGAVLDTQSEDLSPKTIMQSREETIHPGNGDAAENDQQGKKARSSVETIGKSSSPVGSKRRKEICERTLQGGKRRCRTECSDAQTPKVSIAKGSISLPPPPSTRYMPPEAIPCIVLLPPAACVSSMESLHFGGGPERTK